MNKIYTRIDWKNYPSERTPLNEENLNKMDFAIDAIENEVIEMDSTKLNVTDANNLVSDWTMDEQTGVITITKKSGEQVIFDLNIEKIPVNFSMDADGVITMETSDGTKFTANIGDMIPVLEFADSETIAVSVSETGKDKTYSFAIKNGSITEDKLQPNYLADVRVESAKAETAATNARASETESANKAVLAESFTHGGTGKREGEDTDNAKYYMEQAKSAVGGDFVSHDEVGKPNGVASLDANGKVPEEQIPMSKIDVDAELSEESENPVQNKVIAAEIGRLNSDLANLGNRQGVSNPNLLDNAWFTVNQRGQSDYVGSGSYNYCLNRWKELQMSSANIVSYRTDGLWLSILEPKMSRVEQILNAPLSNQKYTISFLCDLDGELRVYTNEADPKFLFSFTRKGEYTPKIYSHTFDGNTDIKDIFFQTDNVGLVHIRAVKLEPGTESTLHLDTAPNEAEELIRCCNSTADPTDEYANGYNPLISDAWVQRTWTAGEICISDNRLWKALVDNSAKPSEGANWKRISVGDEIRHLVNKLTIKTKSVKGTTSVFGLTNLGIGNCSILLNVNLTKPDNFYSFIHTPWNNEGGAYALVNATDNNFAKIPNKEYEGTITYLDFN